MHYLCLFADLYLRIFDFLQVNRVLISQIVEKIQVFLSNFSLLLVTKDEIQPFIQMLAYLDRFQLSPMDGDEIISVLAPNRKMHVMYPLLHLSQPEVMLLNIQQKLRKIVKLRHELSYI